MGISQYYPPGAPELSVNRLFGIFHAKTPQRSKDNIIQSFQEPNGVVRIVFASVAIGKGIDLQGVNIILHYRAPSSIEDYFQVRIYYNYYRPSDFWFQNWSISVSYFLLRNSMS